jgi:creatinine amidohydrolase
MYADQPTTKLNTKCRKIVFLPIGSCEQHGPHLPIDTDLRIAQLIAEKLVQSFPDKRTILLPPIPFSCSWEHKGIGTIALSTSTISSVLHDVALSLNKWETEIFLILINWHGGNSALASIATEITATKEIPTAVIQAISLAGQIWDRENELPYSDVHAGTIETSIIQAYWPELVIFPKSSEIDFVPNIDPATTQPVFQALGIYSVSKTGIWGKPQQADPQKGRRIIDVAIKEIYQQVNKLLELVENTN